MTTDCLFCRIVDGTIPAELVLENADVIGFRDTNPQAPNHVLFVPRKHIPTLNHASEKDSKLLGELFLAAKQFAAEEGFAEAGYRVTMNCNEDGGQTVFHIHLHLLAGRKLSWPPG